MNFDQDTLQKIQIAKQAGHDPNSIIQRAIQYQSAKSAPVQQQVPSTQPQGGGLLDFLTNFLVPTTKKTYQKATSGQEVGGGDIARTLLELGSFLIPFGKGAGLLTRAILPGAGVGLARGLSEEGATPGSVATSVGTGAITAPIIGKLLGGTKPPAGNIANKIEEFGQGAVRQATIAGKSTLPSYASQQAVQQTFSKYLKGSAFNKFKNVGSVIDTLVNKVDDLYRGVTTTIPGNQLGKAAQAELATLQGADVNAFQRIYNRAINKAFGKEALTGKTDLTGLDINAFRRVLNSEARSLQSAIEKGRPPSSADEAIFRLRDITDELLNSIAPPEIRASVQGLNKDISNLIKGEPELQRAGEQSVSLLGTQLPLISKGLTRGFQAGADIVGRGTTTVGSKLEGLLGPAAQQIGTKAGVGAITSGGGLPSEVQTEGGTSVEEVLAALQGGETGGATDLEQPTQIDPIKQAIGKVMLQNAKSIGDLKTAYDFLYPEGKKSDLEKRTELQSQQANQKIDVLEAEFARVQSQGLTARTGGLFGEGRLAGVAGTLAALRQSSKEAAGYRRGVEAFLSSLARATGERGVLTDRDVARIKKLIPNFYDTPEVSAEQFRLLREAVSNAFGQGKTTEAGT